MTAIDALCIEVQKCLATPEVMAAPAKKGKKKVSKKASAKTARGVPKANLSEAESSAESAAGGHGSAAKASPRRKK